MLIALSAVLRAADPDRDSGRLRPRMEVAGRPERTLLDDYDLESFCRQQFGSNATTTPLPTMTTSASNARLADKRVASI